MFSIATRLQKVWARYTKGETIFCLLTVQPLSLPFATEDSVEGDKIPTCQSSVVGRVTRMRCGLFGVRILLGPKIFIFSEISRHTLGLTQLPVQWVPAFFPAEKAAET